MLQCLQTGSASWRRRIRCVMTTATAAHQLFCCRMKSEVAAVASASASESTQESVTVDVEKLTGTAVQINSSPLRLTGKLVVYAYSPSSSFTHSLTPPKSKSGVQRLLRLTGADDVSMVLADAQALQLDEKVSRTKLINLLIAYIKQERMVEEKLISSSSTTRLRARQMAKKTAATRLSPDEVNVLFQKACSILENRQVTLVVASRLLRYRWPKSILSVCGTANQAYVGAILKAWIVEELRADSINPRDARALLNNGAIAFKQWTDAAPLVGRLATASIADMDTQKQADGLIAVMWAVHGTGCHAPPSFWNALVDRVLAINNSLATNVEGSSAELTAIGDGAASPVRDCRLDRAGHFFSSLTTRQIYRLLAVLKKERWGGDATVLHQLADQALKNIAFEVESASNEAESSSSDVGHPKATSPEVQLGTVEFLSDLPRASLLRPSNAALNRREKKAITQRIGAVADLTPSEFLSLLAICGDLAVPFNVSASRVSEELLSPLVPFLQSTELLEVLHIGRCTRCMSTSLFSAVMNRLLARGSSTPYALPIAKSLVRTLQQKTTIRMELNVEPFAEFFLDICVRQHTVVRAAELVSIAEHLYLLSRSYDDAGRIGEKIRDVVDLLCAQMDRLLQLDLTSVEIASRLLEFTITLRLRSKPDQYPFTKRLLDTRNAAHHRREKHFSDERERRLKRLDEMEATMGDELRGPRWETVREEDLPRLPKAALSVYAELLYMMERMMVVRADITATDRRRFVEAVSRAGLFNLLLAAQLLQEGHLRATVRNPSFSKDLMAMQLQQPRTLPSWMEQHISSIVLHKLRSGGLTEKSADDDVLHVLGHVHCDDAKVQQVVQMLMDSPLLLVKKQRPVWLYVRELTRRFGSPATTTSVNVLLSKSLY